MKIIRLLRLLRLLLRYLSDFALANVDIARRLLSRDMKLDPGVEAIPIEAESPTEILALSNLITFTPGTLTLSIEPGETVHVHFLDRSPEATAAIRERLEKPLLDLTRNP